MDSQKPNNRTKPSWGSVLAPSFTTQVKSNDNLGVSSLLYLKYEISIVKLGAVQHSLKEQIIHMAMFSKL